ncbi:protein NLP2-like [Rhododendron vialii]|uniref:protein NLP2-like n=1 Tax=Rhododendron vialii TaxID=182163 RepID=UPI00265E3E13|nr:protein NLP2-like [Rhododendron vialii]
MVVLRESGELESDEPTEESSFEELNCSYSSPPPPTTYSPPWGPANFPDFPPSPTYFAVWGPTYFPPSAPSFPLYLPASPPPPSPSTSSTLCVRTRLTFSHDFQNQQHENVVDLIVVHFALFVDYLIEDRGGALNVINGLEGGALNVINGLELGALNALDFEDVYEDLPFEFNELEHQQEDIVDQLAVDYARVDHSVIGYMGDGLDVISGGGVSKVNGVEHSLGQALSTTPEPSVVIFTDKLSIKLWLGHRGQWVADIRYGWNWLNLGTFRTVEGAPLAAESVKRWRGGKDLFDYPRPFMTENGSESLQLPPTAQEENQDDGIGSEGTRECAMADQGHFNSGGLEKKENKGKEPRGERRKKKANGVRIAIPLDNILQTKGMCLKAAANHLKVSISKLKSSCREYGILRWPPRNEHKLIRQSFPKETPVVVDQEGIPQLTSRTVPSNQALTATVDTNSVVEKEIPLLQFLPTAQQENPGAGFGNNEAEAIGVGVEGTWEAVMEEAQLNSGCLGKKGKRKVNTPGGERGNNRTDGVRIAIPKEDILQTKGMRLIDAAKHLEVSKSTLKRVCREYDIYRWPPRKEQELIGQSRLNSSPAVVDQEQIQQLNPDTLLSSNQVSATSDTYSVKVKVRCEEGTIMFRLSYPWRKVELEQQVKERLSFEAGTYKIEYKDEDDELILINCDKDLEECISSSSAGGSRSIELFLKLK